MIRVHWPGMYVYAGIDEAGYGPLFGPLTTAEVGLVLMWGAALLTLVTGYDYLVAGLRRIAQEDRPGAAPPAEPSAEADARRRRAG